VSEPTVLSDLAATLQPTDGAALISDTFTQAAAASVRLRTNVAEAAAHARDLLWCYARPREPRTPASRHLSVHRTPHLNTQRLNALFSAAPHQEIGPDLTAAVLPAEHGATLYWVEAHTTLICASADLGEVNAYCASTQAATYWCSRLTRQAMTGQLLARGAVYAHAAALSITGHGVLICGPRGAGKTTTLLAALRHLGADYVTNDRLLIWPGAEPGAQLTAYPWPDRMRAGVGMLSAIPDLADLVPASAQHLSTEQLWAVRDKVSIAPGDFPRLLHGGTLAPSCRPRLMVWPHLDPAHAGVRATPVPPHEVARTLTATRLFMRDPTGAVSSRINHWLFPAPGDPQHLKVAISALAEQVPCYRIQTTGDRRVLAEQIATLLAAIR